MTNIFHDLSKLLSFISHIALLTFPEPEYH